MELIRFTIVDTWDTDSLITLYREAGWWLDEYDPDEMPAFIRASFRFCVGVHEITGETVATGRIISDTVCTAIIQDMCVLKRYRGQGIGQNLLKFLIQTACTAGLSRIMLVAEPDTSSFYEQSAFIADNNKIFLLYRKGRANEIT
ncbi:MAG TPA: GNAT family N-acetyltransferase [Methanospirillum sp.]|uniref:GNAT family N-acetyltransferase n=1 Tax=Methanospirillum sp. TaxID=45200 RepID=UPI002CE5C219|nr:GNAT family N-acetyltransferase [Methanospirillum sp.]HOJ95388.1 GNAT family N-acetyltransferase [Methanospirillum sp.]HOL40484.1 GNAT family N-acetyltransferase [Methanospirillum sp.]HPP76715.1 GNAT family N-acetyltransferase [Methanospirillum sp.]